MSSKQSIIEAADLPAASSGAERRGVRSRARRTRPREPVASVLDAIGDTPLVALERLLPARPDLELWGKLESFNPGGSTKDRPAAVMLQDAVDRGLVARGTTVIESSSGTRCSEARARRAGCRASAPEWRRCSVFPNTAGYLMHIRESASHQMPLARNVINRAAGMPSLDPIDAA